jgi:hypothetical protein
MRKLSFRRGPVQGAARTLAKAAPGFFAGRLKRPFFIIGSARSGTTILVDTLASHRQIATFPGEANRLWHPHTYPWSTSPYRDRIPPLWVGPRRFTRFSLEHRSEDETRYLKAVFGAYQFLLGKDFFLNKNAMIAFMIPFVLEVFPGARFIHILRDGLAVAFSYARKEWKKKEAHLPVYREKGMDISFEEALGVCAVSWKKHIEEIEKEKENLDLVGRGLLHEVRYEDFCSDPRQVLDELSEYMGIDPHGFREKTFSHIRNMNFKYHEALTEDTIRELRETMSPTLHTKGYL